MLRFRQPRRGQRSGANPCGRSASPCSVCSRSRPPPRTFADGWQIPEPDLVISMPEPFTVPAEGVVEYQYFTVDPGFREDRWVRAVEVRPGNRKVVHHCNVLLQPPGAAQPAAQGE